MIDVLNQKLNTNHGGSVMAYQELSLLQFKKKFPSEGACRKALAKMRWPQGFVCPKCTHTRAYERRQRRLLECAGCGYQASLTAGTIFHNTRTPLLKWFWAIYLASQDKGGVSAMRLSKQLELGYKPPGPCCIRSAKPWASGTVVTRFPAPSKWMTPSSAERAKVSGAGAQPTKPP